MKLLRNVLFGLATTMVGVFQQGCVTDVSLARMDGGVGTVLPVDDAGSASMEAAIRLLNVQIKVVPSGKDSDVVGDEIRKIIEGELAAKRFRMSAAEPDITVSLTPRVSLFDKSGSYYRYNGKVDVRVVRSRDQRVMGEKKFIAPGERKLDQDEALLGVSQKMGPDAAKWVAEVCVPVQLELAVNDITVQRSLPAAPSSDSHYSTMFVEKVGALQGVASCRLVRHDYESRTMVFRVIYTRELIPSGLMNKIAAIPGLKIRVKQ